jgi:multiple sugar transport system permease protein
MIAGNATPKKQASRITRGRRLVELYVMLLPFLILFVAFIVWPIGRSLYLSLTNLGERSIKLEDAKYVGLDNYVRLFTEDRRFPKAMSNMVHYVLVVVTLNTVVGLLLALALQEQALINRIMRTIFFLPSVTSSIALGILWRWVFTEEDYGLANTILQFFGQESMSFLSNPPMSLPVLVFMSVWGGMGGTMIIFLMLVPYLYDWGFTQFKMGYASSIAWVLFAVIFVLTALNLRIGRANEVD